MKVGWIDGTAGASGDMLLGALVGSGVPLATLQAPIDALDLGVELRVEQVERGGLGATKVHVEVPSTTVMRHLPEIVALFAALPAPIASGATDVFERLAVAEAAVHQTTVDDVHFHEVGALDSIADVVGAVAGFDHLKLDQLFCSTLSLGSGMTRGAHGPLPIPVPAVLQLLTGVTAVQSGPAPFESTTPTGAALLTALVDEWTPMPHMTINSIGMGAGSKDSDVIANALRLLVGTSDA